MGHKPVLIFCLTNKSCMDIIHIVPIFGKPVSSRVNKTLSNGTTPLWAVLYETHTHSHSPRHSQMRLVSISLGNSFFCLGRNYMNRGRKAKSKGKCAKSKDPIPIDGAPCRTPWAGSPACCWDSPSEGQGGGSDWDYSSDSCSKCLLPLQHDIKPQLSDMKVHSRIPTGFPQGCLGTRLGHVPRSQLGRRPTSGARGGWSRNFLQPGDGHKCHGVL